MTDSFLPLPATFFQILLTLEGGPLHGYAIKREVEERTKGVVRLGAGTLYHAIQSLENRALIEECEVPADQEAGSSRWRFYRCTPLGSEVLRAEVRRLEADLRFARAEIGPSEA